MVSREAEDCRGEWHYRYDSDGRVEKRSETRDTRKGEGCIREKCSVTWFVWEGLRLLAEERDGLPVVYIYEEAGSYVPLARVYGRGEKQRVDYYRCSVNGMPEALSDGEGRVHWFHETDAWGKTLHEHTDNDDPWVDGRSEGPEENLRFAGQYLDRETGLHYNLFRYYAPEMGRFITPDPIGLAGGHKLICVCTESVKLDRPSWSDLC